MIFCSPYLLKSLIFDKNAKLWKAFKKDGWFFKTFCQKVSLPRVMTSNYGQPQTFPISGWFHWRWSCLFLYLPSSQFRMSPHNFLLWAPFGWRKVSTFTTNLDYYWRNSKKCRIWIGYRRHWGCGRNSSLNEYVTFVTSST